MRPSFQCEAGVIGRSYRIALQVLGPQNPGRTRSGDLAGSGRKVEPVQSFISRPLTAGLMSSPVAGSIAPK